MKALINFAVILLFGYGSMLLYVYLAQSRLLYLPGLAVSPGLATPGERGLRFADVLLTTSDGISLHGWYVSAQGARGTVLFMHGNAGDIGQRLDSIEIFTGLGLNVFIFDYRGYGRSAGKPTEEGTYRDARAAWRYLVGERGIAPASIVIFGRSLGAAVAVRLASEIRPAALIVESGFTSVPDVAAEVYWFLPVRLLSRFRYNAREMIRTVSCPVLVVHSKDDEIIPFSHGERLFEAAPHPKQFLELSGGHNTAVFVSESLYLQGLQGFLDSIFPTGTG